MIRKLSNKNGIIFFVNIVCNNKVKLYVGKILFVKVRLFVNYIGILFMIFFIKFVLK